MARDAKNGDGLKPRGEQAPTATHAKGCTDATEHSGATIFEIDFDPEGWMSERPRYWLDRGSSMSAGRLASLRRRLREAAAAMGASRLDGKRQPRATEEEWIRLSEQALGPLPRPPVADQPLETSQATLVAPDASQPSLEAEALLAGIGTPKTTDGKV